MASQSAARTTPVSPNGETSYRRHGRGHSYKIDGIKVPGATTIIRNGTPSGGLMKWYAEQVAGCAIAEWDRLAAMAPSERFKYLADAPNRVKTEAGLLGTQLHALAEKLAHGEQVEVPAGERGHVDACVAFLDEWNAQPIRTECHVFSRRWQYGGSPDGLFDVDRPRGAQPSCIPEPAGTDRWRGLLDWKRKAKGPWGSDAFQLAAYRWAEFRQDVAGGEEIPWAWAGGNERTGQQIPLCDDAWIVWLRGDSYQVVPMETG